MGERPAALACLAMSAQVRPGHWPDPHFWAGRRVLLTGHTGFKGSWTALWLAQLGARVTGFSLAPDCQPNLFTLADVASATELSILGDVRDAQAVREAVEKADPELVLHLAAQPIVRRSLVDPVETFATNVLGTAHLLDALRDCRRLGAVLVVTSDKVYAHEGHPRAFVETDRLGGTDPYSASKAAAEIVAASFSGSYFDRAGVRLATARGGNVIGGGDFAVDRLVPDAVRAAAGGVPLILRHPRATRPWQHVLDCVCGYLLYAQALAQDGDLPPALNFGPAPGGDVPVGELAGALLDALGALGAGAGWRHQPEPGSLEKTTLSVDASLARARLGWRDQLTGPALIAWTADWYRAWHKGEDPRAVTLSQLAAYARLAKADEEA
jgi:CDP-glucose 4,6-dehydratase